MLKYNSVESKYPDNYQDICKREPRDSLNNPPIPFGRGIYSQNDQPSSDPTFMNGQFPSGSGLPLQELLYGYPPSDTQNVLVYNFRVHNEC